MNFQPRVEDVAVADVVVSRIGEQKTAFQFTIHDGGDVRVDRGDDVLFIPTAPVLATIGLGSMAFRPAMARDTPSAPAMNPIWSPRAAASRNCAIASSPSSRMTAASASRALRASSMASKAEAMSINDP